MRDFAAEATLQNLSHICFVVDKVTVCFKQTLVIVT